MNIPAYVFSLCEVAARESTRFAIASIHFSVRDGVARAAATDGRRLVEFSWADLGENVDGLPTTLPLAACKAARSWNKPVKLKLVEGRARVTAGDKIKQSVSAESEGPFPKYDDIIPEYSDDEARTIAVDPTLLIGLLETLKALNEWSGCAGLAACEMTFPNDPTKPVVIRGKSDVGSVVAVQMQTNRDR